VNTGQDHFFGACEIAGNALAWAGILAIIVRMKLKASPADNLQSNLFRVELRSLVASTHALVKLADTVA
jgi:hypothetical protein